MNSVTRNFAILFLVLLVSGLVIIVKSYDIGIYFLMSSTDGWDMNQQIFSRIAWIVFGGVISLLSGYGLIRIILKYIE